MAESFSIIIMNHGRFGEELIKSAELIYGKISDIKAVSLLQGMSLDEYISAVREAIRPLKGKICILTDIYGGTPSNVAHIIQKDLDVQIVCGMNLPLLIELVSKRDQYEELETVIEKVIEVGRNSIFQPDRINLSTINDEEGE